MIKVLFLIHDLGHGGAEKVLVNLVNNMDRSKFDITVQSLFDVGVNKQFLNKDIRYKSNFSKMFRGNSKIMKLFSPKLLHKLLIKEDYDIEIAYLEGPCSRIISGCSNNNTKLIAWLHCQQHSTKGASNSFRSPKEAEQCYNKFNKLICVSEFVKQSFKNCFNLTPSMEVYYNTNESKQIVELSDESINNLSFDTNKFNLIGVGKLVDNKGFDRILRITNRLNNNSIPLHTYILGEGPKKDDLQKYINDNKLQNCATLLGYDTNPYKYVAKCDLFVCSSHSEGFSTAATEALIVGTPVCTVDVSGMKEMLGENNEYGIVTENSEDALYEGIKKLLDSPELLSHYKQKAIERGKFFSTEKTVKAVEDMLEDLIS